jgi:hypothetical protein
LTSAKLFAGTHSGVVPVKDYIFFPKNDRQRGDDVVALYSKYKVIETTTLDRHVFVGAKMVFGML